MSFPRPLFAAAAFALAPFALSALSAEEEQRIVDPGLFTGADLFGLTVAADPQISPDGSQIAYVRRTNDIMLDRAVSSIWLIDVASGDESPLVTGRGSHFSPRWSPDGDRLAYVSTQSGDGAELHVRWMETGASANITAMPETPGSISWSPDGQQIAFTARVAEDGPKLGDAPKKPEGARWAKPLQIIDKVVYRRDGSGYVRGGTTQLFLVDAEGGAPRQLTLGRYNNGGTIDWSPDGQTIVYSANHSPDWELAGRESEIYSLNLGEGSLTALTDRSGPDYSPVFSPDGRRIAYLGYDDDGRDYVQPNIYVMDADGSNSRQLASSLDRNFNGLDWTPAGLFAGYEDEGRQRVARISLNGSVDPLPAQLGSTYYALPYTGGDWSVSNGGQLAFTTASTTRPTDIGVTTRRGARQLTFLNELKLGGKRMGETRELAVTAPDGTPIPSWIQLPAGYVDGTPIPMILEMHGGPWAAYGPEFAVDYQLYNAAGYAVLFTNPGGSTGYGQEFANRIEDNYPISNHDELMAAVDAAVAAGYADPDNLFVTGGSGGGALTAWVVGKTDRFKAAATHKPVINWTSFALNADSKAFYGRYWLGSLPWEDQETYWKRSPLSLVGNVTTPTLVLVGAEDYRTPQSEAEQYYGALKLAGVDTALVITPGASHNNLSQSPSQQAARTDAVISWFEKYRTK